MFLNSFPTEHCDAFSFPAEVSRYIIKKHNKQSTLRLFFCFLFLPSLCINRFVLRAAIVLFDLFFFKPESNKRKKTVRDVKEIIKKKKDAG